MIIDTSFLIDVLRGKEDIREVEEEIDRRGTGKITSVSVMELWEGMKLAESAEDEEKSVRKLLDQFSSLEFSQRAAKTAGSINARLKQEGEMVEVEDVMIASIAAENDEEIVTQNTSDFERIEEVELFREKD